MDAARECLLCCGASLSATTRVSARRGGAAAGGCFLISDKCHCRCCIFASCRPRACGEGGTSQTFCSSRMQSATSRTNFDSQSGHRMTNQADVLKTVDRFLARCGMSQMVPSFCRSCKLGAEKVDTDSSVFSTRVQPAKVSLGGDKEK